MLSNVRPLIRSYICVSDVTTSKPKPDVEDVEGRQKARKKSTNSLYNISVESNSQHQAVMRVTGGSYSLAAQCKVL